MRGRRVAGVGLPTLDERRLRRILLVTAMLAAAAAASTSAASGLSMVGATACGSGAGPLKYSSTKTIKGKAVVVNCGPATATIHYKGKTYAFKNGTCFRYLGALKLNLGESLLTPTPGNTNPYPNLTITATPSGQLEVGMGAGKIALYVAANTRAVAAKGTLSSVTSGVSLTGSWNCGGPIRKS